VPFVVAGLKSNQVESIGAKVFHRVSRSEQVIVEHVNENLKRQGIKQESCFYTSPTVACWLYIPFLWMVQLDVVEF
jgi:hypothetical protein